MKHLGVLKKYFWKYRFRLIVGSVFIILSNYFNILQPQLMGYIVDYVQRSLPGYQPKSSSASYDFSVRYLINYLETVNFTSIQVVVIAGLIILGLALVRGFFMFLMRQTIIVMSRLIEADQKNEVFDHYQKLDADFYKTHSTGDLMSRMAEDVSRVRMFTGPAIMYLINLVTLISLSVFFMVRRDAELTLYVLAPLPLLAIAIYYVNSIIHRKSESLQMALSELTTEAQQAYSGIRVIKSFVQERDALNHFGNTSETYRKQASSLAKVEALYFPSMTLVIGLSTLLTIMIGGIYYINGHHNIGIDTIVEFVIYINMLTFPVSAIGWTASMIQRASASQKRLNEFLHVSPSIVDSPGAISVTFRGEVRLKNVNFTYAHTGIQALNDVSLTIEPGQRVAIVGRTGSGKTTLAQLLMRMFDPQSGEVKFDQHPIKNIRLDDIRRQISYVPQDGFLFSDTIESNISFGVKQSDSVRIREAARMAAIADDIESFPAAYKTEIGERGIMLSGGQKQRISIARALMKPAPILILDDCLSAVDARTEQEIFSNLMSVTAKTTTLLITHRVFNLIDFDRIVVMDGGKIKETGNHSQLMAQRGLYFDMYQRQQKEHDAG